MSALEEYADVITTVRNTDLRPEPVETFGEAMRHAIRALADELEKLQPDAKLGKLVSGLWHGQCLRHSATDGGAWEWEVEDEECGPMGRGTTPEEALREALKEQDEAE